MDKKINILLIEDDPGDVDIIREIIAEIDEFSINLETEDRLATGLMRLDEGGIDLVFLDLGLPDSQGMNSVEKVCIQDPNLPIIVLTGFGDKTFGVKALQTGAQEYLVKGKINSEALARSIKYAIGRKNLENSLRSERDKLEIRVQERTAELTQANKKLNKANRTLGTLSKCNHALIHVGEESALLREICSIAVESGDYRFVWIGIPDNDKEKTIRPVAKWGYEDGYLDTRKISWADNTLGQNPSGTAIRTKKISLVKDIYTNARFADWRNEALKRGYASCIALPLIVNGQIFGSMSIYSSESDAFGESELDLLEELASDLSFGIQTIRLTETQKRSEKEILQKTHLLNGINRVLQDTLTVKSEKMVAQTCLEIANKLTRSEFGFIGEVNSSGTFDTIAQNNPGWNACKIPKTNAVKMIKNMEIRGFWGKSIKEEQSIIVNDPSDHPERTGVPEGHPPINSFLGVPLKHKKKTIGMIALANKEGGYNLTDQKAVEDLSVTFVQALNQMRTDMALKKSEEQYRLHFDNILDVIYSLDKNFRLVSISPSVEQLLGYRPEELLGRSVLELNILAPEHLENAGFDIMRILDGEEISSSNYELLAKDGTRKIVEMTGRPLRKDGEIIGVVSVGRDITEKVAAEAKLSETKQMLENIAQGITDGVLLLSNDLKILWANKGAENMSGFKMEQMIGQYCYKSIRGMDNKCRDANYTCPAREVIKTGKPQNSAHTYVFDEKGSEHLLEMSIYPIKDKRGEIVQFVHLSKDVTEFKKLEAQYLQAQKMEAVGRLAGGVAHDFNNLLTSIIGYSELILMDLKKDETIREHLEEIIRAGKSASSLTRQLLAFSRKQTIKPEIINLNDIVTGMGKMITPLIGEDIEIETILSSDLMQIKVDPSQMEQVIMNLLVNARDAMPKGGKLKIETANVQLDASYALSHNVEIKPGFYIAMSLSDTGVGMDKKTQSKIFEPFFTTKEKGKGTGLGLASVYGIVKQNNGYIWVYSEPGHGTIFKIYFPSVKEIAEPVKKIQHTRSDLKGTETILVVEDNKSVRNLLMNVLVNNGYQIFEAREGEEALSIFKQHIDQIQLVLTDVVMPKMSGPKLIEVLQSLKPDIKTVYMSGYSNNAIGRYGVLEKEVNFIGKPFLAEKILKKVRQVLDAD